MMTGPNLEEAGLSTAQARTLNDELIADDTGPKEIRRNSKDDIIRKIMTLCEENQITLEQSNTKLWPTTPRRSCSARWPGRSPERDRERREPERTP